MEPIINCERLTKSYGSFCALQGVTFSLPKGKIVGLLGPNGSGKTTFIKMAAGILTPTSGNLWIHGNPIGIETKKVVSYLPERTYFANWMNVKDCLKIFEEFYEDFDMERALEMIRILQVPLNAKIRTLSKGTQEKVQLVVVMARRAKLYLLDEPIGGVDPAAREFILKTIVNNFAEDATVLISTHLIRDVEEVLDEFMFLSNGRIVFGGTVAQVKEEKGMTVDELFREVFRC